MSQDDMSFVEAALSDQVCAVVYESVIVAILMYGSWNTAGAQLFVADLMVASLDMALINTLRFWCSLLELEGCLKRNGEVETILRSIYFSHVNASAPHPVDVTLSVRDQLGRIVQNSDKKGKLFDANVVQMLIASMRHEALSNLYRPVMGALRAGDLLSETEKKVLALVQGNSNDQERKHLLMDRAASLRLSLPTASTTEELHAMWKAVVPLLIIYRDHDPHEEIEVLFERMHALWPLSADTWRRRALLQGFVSTHRSILSTRESLVFERALSHFDLKQDVRAVERGQFNNAVEAFAQGRSYNSHTISTPDLHDVIHELPLYNCLFFDRQWREELVKVEHAFESSKLLNPKEPKLFWYWALFFRWVADALARGGKAHQSKLFLLAACEKCIEALALKPSYLRALIMAGDTLCTFFETHNAFASGEPLIPSPKGTLKKYLEAFEAHARTHPYLANIGVLSRLLAFPPGIGGDPESVLGSLYDICQGGENLALRRQCVKVLLAAEQDSRVHIPIIQTVFRALDIQARDALSHSDSFLAVLTYFPRTTTTMDSLSVGKDKAKDAGTVSPRTIKKLFKFRASAKPEKKGAVSPRNKEHGGAPLAKRKGSIWVPDPCARFDQELKEADPKKTYTFLGELGVGGFSSVVMARRKSDGLNVAIKVINKPVSQAGLQILAEVQVMRMCKFAYIVDLLDALYWKDVSYLVMRYCDGGSLDKLIESVQLNDPQKAHVFFRVCKALAFLEKLALVHRDVKPANILLSRSGAIRLGDLGLMKPQVEVQYRRSTAGTPHYRAPEVLLGHGTTCKSDVYSFGCAVYTAAHGMPPFYGLSAAKLLWESTTKHGPPSAAKRGLHGKSGSPATLSSGLTSLISRCFALDPVQRPGAQTLLADPFFQLDSPAATKSIEHLCSISFLGGALEEVGFTI